MAGKHRHSPWKELIEILFTYGGIVAGIPLVILGYVIDNHLFIAIGGIWAVSAFLWFIMHD